MADPISMLAAKVAVGMTGAFASAAAVSAVFYTTQALLYVATMAAVDAYSRSRMPKNTRDLRKDITSRGTIEYQKIVYGEALVSGPVAYTNTGGTDNSDLWVMIALAGHECEDVTDVWLDGDQITPANISWNNPVTGGKYEDAVEGLYKGNLGSSTQTYNSAMGAAFPADWTTNHRGRGICWLTVKMHMDRNYSDMWQGGAPNHIKGLVKGKKIYDPRRDPTSANYSGTGSQTLGTASTYEWSDNPALCVADYMTDSDLGMGISTAKIDWDSLAAEADHCDALVSIPTGTEKRFTCNGALSTGQTHRENISKLLSAMNGRLGYKQGKFFIQAGRYISPTVTIDESWFRDNVAIKAGPPKANRFNTVHAFFVDADNTYKPIQAPTVTNSAYVTRDNGETLIRELDLPFTNTNTMAQRIAYKQLVQFDQSKTIILPCNYKALQLAVHEQVQLDLSDTTITWSGERFRVVGWKFSDISENGGIDLVLSEDDTTAYPDLASGDYSTISAAGTITFNTPGIPDPTNFAITGVEMGIELTWTPPDKPENYDTVEIWRNSVNDSGTAAKIAEVRGSAYKDKLYAGETYYYWLRSEFHDEFGNYVAATPTSATASDKLGGIASGAQVNSPIIGMKKDANGFSSGSNGYLYIHGFDDDGNAADVNATIWIDGAEVTVTKGSVQTKVSQKGWLVFDPDGTSGPFLHAGSQQDMALAIRTYDGANEVWKYDKSSVLTTFSPSDSMMILGYIQPETLIGSKINNAGVFHFPIPHQFVSSMTDTDTADWSTQVSGTGKPNDNATQNQIFSGSGTPSAGLGDTGDLYFDSTNDEFYQKNSGVWENTSDITLTHTAATITSQGGLAIKDNVTLETSGDIDRYVEGGFTPTLTDSGGTAVGSYVVNTGNWTRIGNRCYINGRIGALTKGSVSGNMQIRSLPFTSADDTISSVINFSNVTNLNITAGQSISGSVAANSTLMHLNLWDSTGGTTRLQDTEITYAAIIYFEFSGSYEIKLT